MSVNRQFSTDNPVTGAVGPATSCRLPRVPANEDPTRRTRSACSTTATMAAVPDGAAKVQVSKVTPLMLGPPMRRTLLTGRVMFVRVKVTSRIEPVVTGSVWIRISCVSAFALRAMSTEQSVNLSRSMAPVLCVFLTTMPRFVPEPRQLLKEQSVTEAVMPPSPRVHSSRATMNRLTELAPVQPEKLPRAMFMLNSSAPGSPIGTNCRQSSPDWTSQLVARKSVPPTTRMPPVPVSTALLRMRTRSRRPRSPAYITACPPE